MADLTREGRRELIVQIRAGHHYAQMLLGLAADRFLCGRLRQTRLLLRCLVIGSMTWEELAGLTRFPMEQLRQALTAAGNPDMEMLGAVFVALAKRLQVELNARADPLSIDMEGM